MNNYKIKVNDEAESKEAQELFFEMDYKFEFCADIQSCRQSEAFSFPYFVQATEFGQILFAIGNLDKAQELTLPQLRDLVAQSKNEQGLISGADALRALADGEDVECKAYEHNWINVDNKHHPLSLFFDDSFQFRLKPRTIKLELEIPAPFEPKEKDIFWILSTNYNCGYVQILCYRNDEQGERLAQFGAWRTEEEIKQVVAALRGIK